MPEVSRLTQNKYARWRYYYSSVAKFKFEFNFLTFSSSCSLYVHLERSHINDYCPEVEHGSELDSREVKRYSERLIKWIMNDFVREGPICGGLVRV